MITDDIKMNSDCKIPTHSIGCEELLMSISKGSFSYGSSEAAEECVLAAVDLCIFQGEILGIIGRNGAGKTTLFDLLCGLRSLKSGKIIQSVSLNSIELICQDISIPSRLTALEAIELLLACSDFTWKSRRELISILEKSWTAEEFARFHKLKNRHWGSLSTGEKRWLFIAASLLKEKKIYLLDEPTAGVDPEFRKYIWDTLARIKNRGAAIVVSTHLLSELQNRAHRIILLKEGKTIHFQSLEKLVEMYPAASVDDSFLSAHASVLDET